MPEFLNKKIFIKSLKESSKKVCKEKHKVKEKSSKVRLRCHDELSL